MRVGLEYALTKTYRAEGAIAEHLQSVIERHRAEHEVLHVSIDLLHSSRTNQENLAAAAAQRGLDLTGEHPSRQPATVGDPAPETAPLVLLEDFRELFLRASAASLDWEMLAQLAQALRDADLLHVASQCHAQTQRQINWANTMLKTTSPQALASAE